MPSRPLLLGVRIVDLTSHLDNVGTSTAANTEVGRFNIWGNSFAAEDLPAAGSDVVVDAVRFRLPPVGSAEPDNVRCAGQYVALEPSAGPDDGRYDWLYVLAAAERRVEDEVVLHFADGSVDFEPLRVSDFWAAPPVFGETTAFETLMHYPHHTQFGVPATVWCQRVPVTRRASLIGIGLPHNIALHLFAATLLAAGSVR
jgi:hypothetical protein